MSSSANDEGESAPTPASESPIEHRALKLPRAVEQDSRAARLITTLEDSATQPSPAGGLSIHTFDCNPSVAAALRAASVTRSIVRGLEGAQQTLMSEARGLAQADVRSGSNRGARVSRVLLLASDGSKRFYRDVAPLMKYHSDRLLVIRLRLTGDELGTTTFGGSTTARALLLTQKDAVSNLLLALMDDY